MVTYSIHISGLVQGVGFRPHVYRVARSLNLCGEVENNNEGVFIRVNIPSGSHDEFINEIRRSAPPVARIDAVSVSEIPFIPFGNFTIASSEDRSDQVTGVSPDIAVCDACLEDMYSQQHRVGYPFINCTNCGPRFTIIRDLPYDRGMTTMSDFEMCSRCSEEYADVADRRFHAQPVACNHCGPVYSIEGSHYEGQAEITSCVAMEIDNGKIAAIKGMGGFHLVCDATNESAVAGMRHRKQREGKPFAVMCRNIQTARDIAFISEEEESLMMSWQRPVVIVKSKSEVAHSVSYGLDTIGIILPYMPFHYLLFEKMQTGSVVFTSANISDEPVITGNSEALLKLGGIADIIVTYNRDIHNRADDSVARVMNGREVVIRRARGYTPLPVITPFSTEGIFASGAELVNAFAIGKGREAIMSQYIGDLKNPATYEFYSESYELMKRLFRFSPSLVVRDIHPDYLSSSFATNLAHGSGTKIIEVQHHHAHVASCMAENMIDDRVIGLSLDGVGLGDDGHIWGGEVFVAGYTGYERRYHFDYVPVMGADRVSSEPWRSGISYLHNYGLLERALNMGMYREILSENEISVYLQGLERRVNTHLYSSAGRLFDAVASIAGILQRAKFHAEAPMRLEAVALRGETGIYNYLASDGVISFGPTFEMMLAEIGRVDPSVISARFHNTVVMALADVVERISLSDSIKNVVLTGGTFQNNWLVSMLSDRLEAGGIRVLLHGVVPPNDNGLALGQMVIAAAMKEKGLI